MQLLILFTSAFSAFIIFSLGIFVTSRNPNGRINQFFGVFAFALCFWIICLILASSSPTAVDFLKWNRLSAFWGIIMGPAYLFFILVFTNNKIVYNFFTYFTIIFISFLLFAWDSFFDIPNLKSIVLTADEGWVSSITLASMLATLWVILLIGFGAFLAWRFYKKNKDKKIKSQAKMVLVAIIIPLTFGFSNKVIAPFFPTIRPVTTLLFNLSSLLVVIPFAVSTLMYKLFTFTPTVAAETIIKTMNEALILINLKNKIEFVNQSSLNLLGYEREELVDETAEKLFYKKSEWNEFHNKFYQYVKTGKQIKNHEMTLATKDRKPVAVNFSFTPYNGDKNELVGIVGIATDIRESKSFLTNIKAEKNKLSIVLNSVVDGVLALDFKNKVIMTNPAAQSMLGLGDKEILGKNIDKIFSVSEKDIKIPTKDLLPTKLPNKDSIIIEKNGVKLTSVSGKNFSANITSSAIKEGREVGLRAIITISDVSKERELEEMKIDFVSMAAHELRTPLTTTRGYLSFLQDEVGEKLSEEQKSYLDKAFIASTQLASLVDNLLAVSRIEQGAVKLQVAPCDWIKTVKECVANFQPIAKEKNIKLAANLPLKLSNVFVDKFRITEVISNLIANALAYTKPNGKVLVEVEEKNDQVITHIKDTGLGIPQEALPKLFTKFFRVTGILEQGSKGTGLGLYISKAIVEMHHGKIWVESTIGEGSTFSFSLPSLKEKSKISKKEKVLKKFVGSLQQSTEKPLNLGTD